MTHVVRVEFAGPARTQYCSAAGATPAVGDVVVVETEWGVGIGEVSAVLRTGKSIDVKDGRLSLDSTRMPRPALS